MEVKKGGKEAMGEFVYQHVDRFYCIAFIGTLDSEAAEDITVEAMKNVMVALRQINPKQFSQGGV
jgi:hypothetical protein